MGRQERKETGRGVKNAMKWPKNETCVNENGGGISAGNTWREGWSSLWKKAKECFLPSLKEAWGAWKNVVRAPKRRGAHDVVTRRAPPKYGHAHTGPPESALATRSAAGAGTVRGKQDYNWKEALNTSDGVETWYLA